MDIKLAKTNIRKQVGDIFLMSILPTIGKTIGLAALSGLASTGASQLMKKITKKKGKGPPRMGRSGKSSPKQGGPPT